MTACRELLPLTARNAIAARIRELRNTREVWAPLAPLAHRRCIRGMGEQEFASARQPVSLYDLVHLAESFGKKDLDAVHVKFQVERVPYEDDTMEVVQLSTTEKLSDAQYQEQIDLLWDEYQRAKHSSKDARRRYEQFLALKAEFEPN